MVAHVGILSLNPPSCFTSLPRLPRFYFTKRKPFLVAAAMGDDPITDWIMSEGKATKIIRISPVCGDCINVARRYDTDAGPFFVKTNRSIETSMFEGEALGLGAMYETNTIRVPKPYQVGPLPMSGSYIIMEFIEVGASRGNQPVLGRKLAKMHKAGKSEKGFGFEVDNTIGSTPQINTWTSDWIEFYGQHRLGYQLKLSIDQYGDSTIYQKGQRLVKNMAPLFENIVIEPCLLHGDLWSGNISSDKNGEPVVLDPACYYGHNEAEFGMSWCAGFGGAFYNAYFEVMPKQPGLEKRRGLYMLYHYLNHYNLFGSGYRSSAMSILLSANAKHIGTGFFPCIRCFHFLFSCSCSEYSIHMFCKLWLTRPKLLVFWTFFLAQILGSYLDFFYLGLCFGLLFLLHFLAHRSSCTVAVKLWNFLE